MNSPLLKRIASAVVAILLFIYLGYQIYNANYAEVQTETATYASTADTVQATGTAIRKERLMNAKVNGVITYSIGDGGKVANGGTVAQVYANAQSAAAQQQIAELDYKISKLQKLTTPGDTYAASPDSISKQINLKFVELLNNVQSGEYTKLTNGREDLLYLINERQIVTDKTANFNTRIASLKAQREALSKSNSAATGSVTAPASGYFISSSDGYESVFDYDKVLTLTPAEFKEKQKIKPAVQSGTIGKICENYDWYFASVVTANQAIKFKVGDQVSIQFPFASNEVVPAFVAAVNQADKDSEAVVVLQSNSMNSSLALIRNATAQIQIEEYTGIRVSEKAIHFATLTKTVKDTKGKSTTVKKEVKGVYVMHGSEIEFRQVFPLFSTGNYTICRSDPPKKDLMTDSTVKLFDEVVVEGTDLYDGKVVK
nr:HlyD family efflux transporter periplasmic adaptor subunit [uncultured Caproiciproducens sp.]